MKGLCPFHDEKSPSFNVNPTRELLPLLRLRGRRRRHRLPDEDRRPRRSPRRSSGWPTSTACSCATRRAATPRPRSARPTSGRGCSRRTRSRRPTTPSSSPRPTAQRPGSSSTSAASTRTPPSTFGVGFAPRGGEELLKHLRQKGFTDAELVTGGLVGQGQRGHYDRFRGRLLWPIRETSGDTIGFGARRIFDDDRIEAKYLNTPETPIYKKSQVLYGIDLARRDIARAIAGGGRRGLHRRDGLPPRRRADRRRHLRHRVRRRPRPGAAPAAARPRRVPRRGDLHLRRRRGRPEGRAAGLRGRPELRRPDLRRRRARAGSTRATCGCSRATPRCASWSPAGCRSTASCSATSSQRYDLDRADGRVDAMREAAKLVSASATGPRSRRSPASWPAWSASTSSRPAPRCSARPAAPRRPRAVPSDRRGRAQAAQAPRPAAPPLPDLRDPRFCPRARDAQAGRAAPGAVGRMAQDVGADDFTHPTYRAVWEAVAGCGGPAGAADGEAGSAKLRDASSDPAVVQAAVARWPSSRCSSARSPTTAYVAAHVFRLQELTAMRRIADLKSRLQRTNPVEHADGVQPDVRRARRPRAAPPHAAREGHRRRAVRASSPRGREGARRRARARRSRPRRAGARAHGGRPTGPGCSAPATRWWSCRPPAEPVATVRWEQVETADWDRDEDRLRVAEVGEFGQPRPAHEFTLADPGGCSSWSASGSPPASCCSAGSPVRGALRLHRGRPPAPHRRRRDQLGGASTTSASTPRIPVVARGRRGRSARRPGRGRRPPSDLARSRRSLLTVRARSPVAQLAEHSAVNRRVVGSSPTGGASKRPDRRHVARQAVFFPDGCEVPPPEPGSRDRMRCARRP